MVKLNKIYTRTGDDGTTGLVGGSRIAKSAPLMAAIGDVDEANSWVGLAAVALDEAPDAAAMLTRIQNELFDLGADLATPPDAERGFGPHDMALRIVPGQIARLEEEIDAMNAALEGIVQDVGLLHSLGVRVVLVLGSTEQIDEMSATRNIPTEIVDGYRITDRDALEVAMEAAGRNNVLVQALFSRGVNVAVARKHGENTANTGGNGGFAPGGFRDYSRYESALDALGVPDFTAFLEQEVRLARASEA